MMSPDRTTGRGIEILIVEDSPVQAKLLQRTLAKRGYCVSVAANGKDALALMYKRKPMIVISDIIMPEMDGYQLCRQIKADEQLKGIPVILLTSLFDARDVIKGLECGADNFLTKPCDENYLLSRIEYIISNGKLRQGESVDAGVEVFFAGQKHFIKSERRQILDFLLATYDAAVKKNLELTKAQDELRVLNEQLEQKVEERTAALTAEIAERKRVEAALSKSETLFHGLFEFAPDPVVVVDHQDHIVRINTQTEKVFAYSRNELLGKPIEVLIPEHFRDRHMRHCADYVSDPCSRPMVAVDGSELYGRRKDGSKFPLEISLGPLETSEGLLILTVIRDISDRKQKENEIRRVNRALRVLSACNQAVIHSNDEVRLFDEICRIIVDVGSNRMAWVGLTEHDEAKTVRPVARAGYEDAYLDTVKITWTDTETERGPTGTAIRTGKPVVVTNMLTDPQYAPWQAEASKRGYASSIALPLIVEGQTFGALNIYASEPEAFDQEEVNLLLQAAVNLSYGVLVLRTRTARHRAEEALRKSERRFRALIENSSDAVTLLDANGTILYESPAVTRILGYGVDELVGANVFERLHPEDLQNVMNLFNQLLQRPNTSVTSQLRYRHKNGSWPWIEATGANLLTEPSVQAVVVNFRDITERKLAEEALARQTEELTRSNAELEQFAYVASHDLQEPLRMVASYVQLLARRYKDRIDADADEFIEYAVDGARRMQGMINDLLAYSRVGRVGRDFRSTDCTTVLDQTLSNLRAAIEESGASVTHDDLPKVMADGSELTQLLQNLISNAVKFRSEKPPKIHISAERKDGEWLFSVRDNGIGIDPQYAVRIFLIFQRLRSRGKYPGNGIGLAICKKIVERHGGRIWVGSQPGKGATFYFTLPA